MALYIAWFILGILIPKFVTHCVNVLYTFQTFWPQEDVVDSSHVLIPEGHPKPMDLSMRQVGHSSYVKWLISTKGNF